MNKADSRELEARELLLRQIVTLDDLTEQKICNLRALTYSNIHFPRLNVDPKTFARWSSKRRRELETIVEYDAHTNCVMVKGRPYIISHAITMSFNSLFYDIMKKQGFYNFDFHPSWPTRRFTFVGPYENTQLVPEAYLKAKQDPFPRHVLLIGPLNSLKNIATAARHWILGTAGITKTATVFVVDIDRPPTPVSALINSFAFMKNYGLSDDEVRSVYGEVPALATHILDWYFEHTPLKLGGEYICKIYTFDQQNVNNGKYPIATLRFTARHSKVSDISIRNRFGEPIFVLEGQVLNLSEVVNLLQRRVRTEASNIAVYLARWKLAQLGVLQDLAYGNDFEHNRYHTLQPDDHHEKNFEEEIARTMAGRQ